jgi:hypothetical protein
MGSYVPPAFSGQRVGFFFADELNQIRYERGDNSDERKHGPVSSAWLAVAVGRSSAVQAGIGRPLSVWNWLTLGGRFFFWFLPVGRGSARAENSHQPSQRREQKVKRLNHPAPRSASFPPMVRSTTCFNSTTITHRRRAPSRQDPSVPSLVPHCVNYRMSNRIVLWYRRPRASGGPGARSAMLALDARFRGHDEGP